MIKKLESYIGYDGYDDCLLITEEQEPDYQEPEDYDHELEVPDYERV